VWLATWAVPLIGRTTRRTPVQGSVIETGNPELTTGERAEVGALVGGLMGNGNPPPDLWLLEEQRKHYINGYRRIGYGSAGRARQRDKAFNATSQAVLTSLNKPTVATEVPS
jgi:hypothetical protein